MKITNSNISRAEEIKILANEAFKAHKYSQAIDLYTQAIEVNTENAVYWANRAFAHTKLEEYGSAIEDASRAVEIDPEYSKGYYRRGAAYLAMGKFKEALKDFQQDFFWKKMHALTMLTLSAWKIKLVDCEVFTFINNPFVKKIHPNDPDAAKRLKECEKAVSKLRFEETVAVPDFQRLSIANSIESRSIGAGPGSSYVPPEVVVVAVAVVLLAILVVLGLKSATVVATAAMATLLVVMRTHWWNHIFTQSPTVNLVVEPQYTGARIEGDVVTLAFVKKMMDDFKNQKSLHKRYAFQIILQTKEMLQALPSLVDINIPDGKHFTVCGDVHGQFYDLLNIFELNGLPSEENQYLFNGDFVDRGSFSVEVILTLFAFKCISPSAIHLSRGNHESKSMNKIYGFEGEVRSKLNESFMELFAEVFCCLPLAHVINKKIFVVHGGLFSVEGVKLSDIRAIHRFCEPPEEGLMCELLWSDPQPNFGRGPSKRGIGVSFGPDVTKRFLHENNLDLVVRSHEVKDEGYEIEHDGKLITVFSAPNYCDLMGNMGAFIRFEAPSLKPNIITFPAAPHPDVKPMAYSNNFFRLFS